MEETQPKNIFERMVNMLKVYVLLVKENLSRYGDRGETDDEFFDNLGELYVEGVYQTAEEAIRAREIAREEYVKNKRHILSDLILTLGALYDSEIGYIPDYETTDYQSITGYVPAMDDDGEVYNCLACIGFHIISFDEYFDNYSHFRIEL